MRIGHGYDVHALTEGRPLMLGGVSIPHEKGLAGHSDADVLLHALCDAMLGAAALGDLGTHFPDSDNRYLGISGLALLKATAQLMEKQGYRLVNADCTVIAQRPKIAPYVSTMRANIAAVLGVDASAVSVKATTEEGLGFTGREEGVAAAAVCLIEQK